jgi:hypothetical protein
MAGSSAMMVLDQRELDFPRIVGLADRPVSATIFRRPVFHHKQHYARGKH